MLIRLLNPALFANELEMLSNRHRLNAVVIRRTKAEACAPDGSPLFARRQVHSLAFTMSESERAFYEALRQYLTDGYNLAESRGNAGRALGFVMTIFQKIAASSFAAVRATLERRLLMLTVYEALSCEQAMDVDGRDRALAEARVLLQKMHNLGNSPQDAAQTDRLLAEARLQLLKRLKQRDEPEMDNQSGSEATAASEEESASLLVSLALPEERRRIQDLLARFPTEEESKAREIVRGLQSIWQVNPREKIVVFTTYLGSVSVLHHAIRTAFPGIGVEVLKGGDHGAKIAAERRFRQPNGPQVLICTAAGREGINLQFAHVLFNADLPWNPMDLEQRIGRIHRYGQKQTAQVYNLVAADTVEGKIYLLLEQKVHDIAKTLGKVDERGEVAEDLRTQILGQLSERLSYEKLYQEGLQDPTLQRTRLEVDMAMQNAELARHAVSELFQDLEGFRLDEYREVDDAGQSIERMISFITTAAHAEGGELLSLGESAYKLALPGEQPLLLTNDRNKAMASDELDLVGLEQPLIAKMLARWANLPLQERALVVQRIEENVPSGVLSAWKASIHGEKGAKMEQVCWLGLTTGSERSRWLEQLVPQLCDLPLASPAMTSEIRTFLLSSAIPGALQRHLEHIARLPHVRLVHS
jgi:hypothetical protein